MRTRTTVIFSACIFALGSGGCADDAAAPAQHGLSVVASALGCDSPNGDGVFPDGSTKVVLQVSGGALALEEEPEDRVVRRAFAGLNDDGMTRIDELPFGEDMIVEVVACDANDDPVWAGKSGAFDIVEGEPATNVVIVLSPLEQFVATGICGAEPAQANPLGSHAYAALTVEEDVTWVLGGFDQIVPDGGTKKLLDASADVERYDRIASTFEAQGSLNEPRAMALVQSAGERRIRLVGGVVSVTTGLVDLPNLLATRGPEAGVAFYDVATGQEDGVVPDVTFPALPGVAALDDGRAVVVGGRDLTDADEGADPNVEPPVYSAQAWIVPAGQPDEAGIKETEILLNTARYGATVVAAGTGALVWGGAVEDPTAARALWIDADNGTAVPLAGADGAAQTLFGAGHYAGEADGLHRFIVLGGAEIGDGPSFEPSVNAPHGVLVKVDVAEKTVTSTGLVFTESADQLQRAGASLFELSDGSFWLVGGYQSFGNSNGVVCGALSRPCLPPKTLRFSLDASDTVEVLNDTLDLPDESDWQVGAFGSAAILQSDGSWLVTPGFRFDPDAGEDGEMTQSTSEAALVRFGFEDAEAGLCEVSVDP